MKWSILQRGNGILGLLGTLEPFRSPWREKKTKPSVPIATLKKKFARMRGIFGLLGSLEPFRSPWREKKRQNQMFLQDLHSFAPLRNHKFEKISSTFSKILLTFHKISIRINVFHTDLREISSEFHEIFTKLKIQQISKTSGHYF